MAIPRALIEMVVDGAAESQRRIQTVRDALQGMNNESLQRISGSVSDLGERYANLQSTISGVAGFAIAGVSLATLGAKISDVLGQMGELDDLSQKIGTSVEELSRIQKVAKAFGVDFAGSIDPALVKLARGLTTVDDKSSKTAKALAAIGVSAKDSAGKLRDPGEVMVEVAKSLQKYQDGAGKAAVVTDLFGKSGADLLPFFNDLAENIDTFSTTSTEAVQAASALQDKFGMLGERTNEVFTQITSAALPSMTSLVDGFTDVMKAEAGMVNGSRVTEWTDNLAVGLARVADVAVLVPRLFSAVSSSLNTVSADVQVLWALHPTNMAYKLANGGAPLDDFKKALASRNKLLAEANQEYDDLWNKPANQFEQAVLNRISNRTSDVKPAASSSGADKPQVNHSSGDIDQQASAYENLARSIQAKIAQTNMEVNAGAPLEASQLEQIKLNEQLAAVKGKVTPIQYAHLQSLAQEQVTNLELIESHKRSEEGLASMNKMRGEYAAATVKTIQDALSEAERNEDLARTFGKTKGEIEALSLARLEDQRAQAASKGLTLQQIADLEELIAAKKRSSTALAQVDAMEAGRKAAESLDEFLDPARAQTFGEALRESLGSAGTALQELTSSLDGFSKRQAQFDEQRENARIAYISGKKTEMQYMQDLSRLGEMESKNRMQGYGDMAGAAAGFFGEQSRGYNALMTVSKVFHAAELAMTMAELVPKGIAAVLNQGSGDPYTAFGRMAAMAAVVGGLGVAIGGVSGSKVSLSESRQKTQGTGTVLGSDAKSDSIARALAQIEQSSQDTLGVSNNMLIALRNIESNIGQFASLLVRTTGVTGDFGSSLAVGGGFNKSGINAIGAIGGGLAGGLAGGAVAGAMTMGVTGATALTTLGAVAGPIGMAIGAVLGAVLGKSLGKAMTTVFGGKKSIEDTGFTIDKANFATIASGGLSAMQYADVKKSGGWFGSDKNLPTALEGLGNEGNRQVSGILMSLYDTVFEAGQILGLGADSFNAQLSQYVVDIGKVSLKGKTDDEIQKELSAVFSKVGDSLAAYGVAGLERFQQVGEGYLETLARVASNYAGLDAIMASIGSTFGAAGIESLAARERLIGMSGGISELAGQAKSFADNFLTEAQRLAPVQKYVTDQLAAMNLAWVDTREEFASVTLGIDKTTEAGAKQFTVMMSLADVFAQVYPAIEDMTRSLQDVADERKSLQDRLDELTMTREQLLAKERAAIDNSNRPLWDRIQALQAEAAVQEERASLQDQLDQLTMTREQLLAKERAAVHESNLPIWDRIQALKSETAAVEAANAAANQVAAGLMGDVDSAFSVLQRVVDREKSALQSQIANHTEAASKIRAVSNSLRSTIDGMRGPGAEAMERARAQSDLKSFLALARAGGVLPDSDKLQAVLATLTQDASKQFASFADYQADFYATKNTMADLASISDAALSTEERTLKTLEDQMASYDKMLEREQEQIDQLKGLSTIGLSINDAILALRSALLAAGENPINASISKISEAYQTSLGRAPDAAGLDFWKGQAGAGTSISDIVNAIGSSPEAKIKALYKSTFGRVADAGGLQFWMARLSDGMPLSTIEQAMMSTDEYKNKGKKIPGFAAGGAHAGGWRIVGENGPELEATGAARIFNAGQTQDMMLSLASPRENNQVLAAAVDRLMREVEGLRAETRAVATHTEKSGRLLGRVIRNDSLITSQDPA